jgi:hypothetical protein
LRIILFVFILIGVFTLLGCGPNTYGIARKSPAELSVVNDVDLCYAQRYWRSPNLLSEISHRNLDCSTRTSQQLNTDPNQIQGNARHPLSTTTVVETIRIGNIVDGSKTSGAAGCGCSFGFSNSDNNSSPPKIFFVSGYDGVAWMNINGKDTELHPKGIKVKSQELDRKYATLPIYSGEGVVVKTNFHQTDSCPPEPTECEVTSQEVTVTVEKDGLRQTAKGKGSCSC